MKELMTLLVIVLFAFACLTCDAGDPVAARYGITLNAGETLVAVNGVPVRDDQPRVFAPIRRTVHGLQAVFPILDRKQVRATRQCRRDARGSWICGSQ